MKLNEINIRDPFVLPYDGKYYMYGTRVRKPCSDAAFGVQNGFDVYVSPDLENWSEPILCFEAPEDFWAEKHFWAPEVHQYNGRFYMLASFYADGKMRVTQALVSDDPQGPFEVCGEPLTPKDWMCLDGTLYIENDTPYLVFCHEWLQAGDGEIAIIPLKKDLSAPSGEAKVLFKASESGWAEEFCSGDTRGIVTDGPWIQKDGDHLVMFWSSFHHGCYAVGMAVSKSGSIFGPWQHLEDLLFEKDGGHGMCFTDFQGKQYFLLHQPNCALKERPHLFEIRKKGYGYELI